jgi:RNase H-like domain found in reverse transcriptase/Integrase zinc binding domain
LKRTHSEASFKVKKFYSADSSLPYEVQTDAFETGIGAVLQQKYKNGTRPVAYMSRKLNAAEQNYTVHERELLDVVGILQDWSAHLSRRQARCVLFLQDFHFDWEYVSGASNRAADALSRKDVDPIHSTWGSLNLYNDPSKPHNFISKGSINAMVIVNSETIDKLPSQYAEDPDFASLFANPTGFYRVKDGRLFKDNILCVPQGPLRDTILHDHHDAAVSGHLGFATTLSSIRRSYFWPTFRKDAEGYVKSCDACQRAKALRKPLGGLIRPFPPPMKKLEVISMDFVFDLPLNSSGKSGIAVIADKLSRQAHFLSLPPKFDAVDLAHLYLHEVCVKGHSEGRRSLHTLVRGTRL